MEGRRSTWANALDTVKVFWGNMLESLQVTNALRDGASDQAPLCPLLLEESVFQSGALVPTADPDGVSSNSWTHRYPKILVPPLATFGDVCHAEGVKSQSFNPDNFLPVVVLASSLDGLSLLRSLLDWDKVLVVAVVTDNVTDSNAKIGPREKRWPSAFTSEESTAIQAAIINSSLSAGVSVFLGGVNQASYNGQADFIEEILPAMIDTASRYCLVPRDRLDQCLGIMCTFGQVLRSHVLNAHIFERYGIVNVHPSDLRNDSGAGPSSEVVTSAKDGKLPIAIHYALPKVDASEALILQTECKIELPPLRELGNSQSVCPDIRRLEISTPGHAFQPISLVVEAKLQLQGRIKGELSA